MSINSNDGGSTQPSDRKASTLFTKRRNPDIFKMDSFFKTRQEILDSLKVMDTNSKDLEHSFQTVLTSVSEEEIRNEELLIGAYTKRISREVTQIREALKNLEHDTGQARKIAPEGNGNIRIRVISIEALKQKLAEALRKFHEIQAKALTKQQSKIKRQFLIGMMLWFAVNF